MNKTLYIKDEDVPIWDRARELAGDKLSPVIVAGLKRFIAEKEAEEALARGFKRIELSYWDADNHNVPTKKAFIGKWIFSEKKPHARFDEDQEEADNFALAVTAKGNVVIYSWTAGRDWCGSYRFRVYPSLEAAAADPQVNGVAISAIETIGVPVEELDI